jgi:adenosine deaminase
MNDNFTQTFAAIGLHAQHAYMLAHNSFEASFIDASAKRRHIDRLDACFATFA